jgi:hypothetical protein
VLVDECVTCQLALVQLLPAAVALPHPQQLLLCPCSSINGPVPSHTWQLKEVLRALLTGHSGTAIHPSCHSSAQLTSAGELRLVGWSRSVTLAAGKVLLVRRVTCVMVEG